MLAHCCVPPTAACTRTFSYCIHTSTWKTHFAASDYRVIPFLNLATLTQGLTFQLQYHISLSPPPPPLLSLPPQRLPLSAEDCLNEGKIIDVIFHSCLEVSCILLWCWRLSRGETAVLPVCGNLFNWCGLLLWEHLYDYDMCYILLLADGFLWVVFIYPPCISLSWGHLIQAVT